MFIEQVEKMANTIGMNEYEKGPVRFRRIHPYRDLNRSRDRNDSMPVGISRNMTHVNNNDSAVTDDLFRAEIRQKKEECRACRGSIIKNWKILKKYVYPVDLLEELCGEELLKEEDFGDLNEMNRSLAQDIVLTACYNKMTTKGNFEKLKAAVKRVNPGADIEWDGRDGGELPSDRVHFSSDNLDRIRPILVQKVKLNVAIDIKDDFLIQSIITVDEHEQIANDLRKNRVTDKFIQMIIDKKDERSFDCLAYSLKQFNEKQKHMNQINIKTLFDYVCGRKEPSASSNTRNSVQMVQGKANQLKSASTGCKVTLNLADNNEQEQYSFHKNVEHNVANMTSQFVQVLGSHQTGTDSGSVIILLKSLERYMGNRIQQSISDGSFVKLLDKLFNDKDIRTSLSKGEYKLEVTIEPYEGQVFKEESEYLPVNEMSSLPNIIKANRSFLIEQINVMALLKAFNNELIEKFKNAGIHEAIEITKKAEVFLDVVDKEGFHEEFYNILKKIRMTYVLNRLQTYQEVCSADYSNMRRNIIQKFGNLVSNIDIDDMKGTFIERKVFDIPMFDRLEEEFGENKEQATSAFLIEILKIGREAVVTLVDVLYINAMDELANELLVPLKLTTVEEEDAEMELSKSEGLLFEGTFRVFVKETDSFAMDKKEAVEEACLNVPNFAELQPDVKLGKDKPTTELDEKSCVEQGTQRYMKDEKTNQVGMKIGVKQMDEMDEKEAVEETYPNVLNFDELQPDVKLGKEKPTTELDEKSFDEQWTQRYMKDKKTNQKEIEIGVKNNGPSGIRQGTPSLQLQGYRPRVNRELGPHSLSGEEENFQRSMLRFDRGAHRRPEPAPRQMMLSYRSNRSPYIDSRYRPRGHYTNRGRACFVGARGYDDVYGSWDRHNQGSRGGSVVPWMPSGFYGPSFFNYMYSARAPQDFDGPRGPVSFDGPRSHSGFDRHRGRGGFDGPRNRDDYDRPSVSFGNNNRSMGLDDFDGQRSREWVDRSRGRGSFDGKRVMHGMAECQFPESFRERPHCGLMEIE